MFFIDLIKHVQCIQFDTFLLVGRRCNIDLVIYGILILRVGIHV